MDSNLSSLNSDEDEDEGIEIDNTFTRHNPFPGGVKIVVEGTTFWLVIALRTPVIQDKIPMSQGTQRGAVFCFSLFSSRS